MAFEKQKFLNFAANTKLQPFATHSTLGAEAQITMVLFPQGANNAGSVKPTGIKKKYHLRQHIDMSSNWRFPDQTALYRETGGVPFKADSIVRSTATRSIRTALYSVRKTVHCPTPHDLALSCSAADTPTLAVAAHSKLHESATKAFPGCKRFVSRTGAMQTMISDSWHCTRQETRGVFLCWEL